jgi:hypothetical protein
MHRKYGKSDDIIRRMRYEKREFIRGPVPGHDTE